MTSFKRLQHEKSLSPSEIAAAIMRLETRQTGGTPHDQEAPLAELLQQINPHISPEEVRQEALALRTTSARLKRRKRRLYAAVAALFAVIGGTGMVISRSLSLPEPSITYYSLSWPQIQGQILVQDKVSSHPIIRTLTEVPDNHMVMATADAMEASATDGMPSGEPPRQVDNDPSEMRWRIFKSGNYLYVRGWTRERLSPSASKLGPIQVFDTPTAPELGAAPVQVSVRLTPGSVFNPFAAGNCYEDQRTQRGAWFRFSSLQDDTHTWEKW